VNGGNGSALGVGKEQWDAVGGTNSDRHARTIGHEGIAGTGPEYTWRIASERHDVASVHLIEHGDVIHAQRRTDVSPGHI
jgi:hypothetical protein